jgi:hypothetical protein
VIGNTLAFWNRERLGLELTPGVDEVSLALVADAWSRTFRSPVITFSRGARVQQSRNGLRIIAGEVAANWPAGRLLPEAGNLPPAQALDEALEQINTRYGTRTAARVAMQLEYPGPSRAKSMSPQGTQGFSKSSR